MSERKCESSSGLDTTSPTGLLRSAYQVCPRSGNECGLIFPEERLVAGIMALFLFIIVLAFIKKEIGVNQKKR